MHALLVFFTLVFSMSHAASIRRTMAVQPDFRAIPASEPAPSRAEIAHYQDASVYAGSGCVTCQKTGLTYSER